MASSLLALARQPATVWTLLLVGEGKYWADDVRVDIRSDAWWTLCPTPCYAGRGNGWCCGEKSGSADVSWSNFKFFVNPKKIHQEMDDAVGKKTPGWCLMKLQSSLWIHVVCTLTQKTNKPTNNSMLWRKARADVSSDPFQSSLCTSTTKQQWPTSFPIVPHFFSKWGRN